MSYTKEELLKSTEFFHKEIPYHDNYIINNNGEIFSTNQSNRYNKNNYSKVSGRERKNKYATLFTNGKETRYEVGYLVASTFLGQPYKYQIVKYIDGNSLNVNLDNLYFGYNDREDYKYYTKDELLFNDKVEHKEVPNYPGYIANIKGDVFSNHFDFQRSGLFIKLESGLNRQGRRVFHLKGGKVKLASNIIISTFVGPKPIGMEVCHNNGIRDDDRLDNLRYDTPENNQKDKEIHGTIAKGENLGTSKLKNEEVYEIKKLLRNGYHYKDIGSFFNVSDYAIFEIQRGRLWKSICEHNFIPKQKDKILVVGGIGYITGKLVDVLDCAGYQVTVYDNMMYEDRYLKPVDFVYGDIRETDKLVDLASNFDKVIWAAALVGDQACEVNPEITREINFLCLERFCEKLPKNIGLLHISTCSVYGQNDNLLNEESPTKPLSTYAITKLLSETPVLKRGGICVRLGTVYGMGDAHSRIRFDLVANLLTAKAWKYKEIHINGGSQQRPIISVHDIVGYLYEWCRRDDIASGIYILSSENVSLKELGYRIAKCFGKKIKIIENDINVLDTRNYMVDNSKALKTFNFKPQIRLEKECKKLKKTLKESRIKNFEDPIYHNGIYLKFKKGRNEFN